MTNIYRNKIMLVSLNVRQWSGRKLDKNVTNEINSSKHADLEAGRYNKRLGPKEYFKDVVAAVNLSRTTFYKNTLPWNDNGWRVLPTLNYMDCAAEIDMCRHQFNQAVEAFLDTQTYANFMLAGKAMLGDMWDVTEYPTTSELRGKFGFDFGVMPMPDAADFRCDLGDEVVSGIQSDIERRVQDASRQAFNDCFERLYSAVNHMAGKLGDPDARFHESMIDNIKELVRILPKLNFYDDPDLNDAINAADALTKYPAQVLRDHVEVRRVAASGAQALADKVKGWL